MITKTLPTWDELDGLALSDTLKLRDVAHDLADEVRRLRAALQVCDHVVHRQNMTDAPLLHAAQQAAGAWETSWRPKDVHCDLPNFTYPEEER